MEQTNKKHPKINIKNSTYHRTSRTNNNNILFKLKIKKHDEQFYVHLNIKKMNKHSIESSKFNSDKIKVSRNSNTLFQSN